ncbi:MAG: hypothetical protein DWG76_01260 [Chloroflexi bacterium]|nr:hypothetical protein [Chloroflexota bacterium]
MATSEERLKILQMIQEGKISAEDGTRLLDALNKGANRGPTPPRGPGRPGEARYLRVRVTNLDTGTAKVNVSLPLSLVDAGMNIAASFVPGVATTDISEAISSGMVGKVIDVTDEEDREHVEIYIE